MTRIFLFSSILYLYSRVPEIQFIVSDTKLIFMLLLKYCLFFFQCSAECGQGQRTRDVACMKKFASNLLHVVSDENCQGEEKPLTQEECTVSTCGAKWFTTEWNTVSEKGL